MPANVVKTQRDEDIWNYAKTAVEKTKAKKAKTFKSQDWGLVMKIFQSAKKKYQGKSLPQQYTAMFQDVVEAKYFIKATSGDKLT